MAIAEMVWRRVIDPMMQMILVAGGGLSFLLGLNVEGNAKEIRTALLIMHTFVTLIVIFVGSIEVPRDISTKNVQFFLSKPLGRGTYLVGKFLGILFLGMIFFGVFTAGFACGNAWNPNWDAKAFGIIVAQLTLQLLPLAALLVTTSVILPELASTIFAIAFYIAGLLIFLIPAVARVFLPGFLRPIPMAAYYALPNWQHYLWTWEGGGVPLFLLMLTAYSLAYSVVILLVADFWFLRRDLN